MSKLIYKTVYGKFKGKYIEAKEGLYWLTIPINYNGFGYTLLRKNHRGSYEPIKVLR